MSLVSLYPNETYEILDSVQGTSLDTSLVNGVFTLGSFSCNYRDITKAVITASVAGTAQVTTLTPTAANSSTYEFTIQQYHFATGQYYYFNMSYTTPASGGTATTIGDAFRAAIAAQKAAGSLAITGSGTSTIILTADAPDYKFNVIINETGGGLTQSTETAAVIPVNTTASLALQGITVTNASYTSVEIQYNPISGYDNKDSVILKSENTTYINQGDGDAAALIVTLRYILDGRSVSATGPANNEALSVL